MTDELPVVAEKRRLRRDLRDQRRRRLGSGAASDPPSGEVLAGFAREFLDGTHTAPARTSYGTGLSGRPLRIAAFHPMPTEPDVLPLLGRLLDGGAQILLPTAAGDRLDWAPWDGKDPVQTSPEPGFGREPSTPRLGADALAQMDLVLAPALAVDRSGTRLGHGRGLYDRALAHLSTSVPVFAVVHPWEVLGAGVLPREAHDQPVHGVLTTAGLLPLPAS